MQDASSIVQDILDSLEDLGISNGITEEASLLAIVDQGPASKEFVSLVANLANELAMCYQLEERITLPSDSFTVESFLFEISGFLSEFGCPYSFLTQGDLSTRLRDKNHNLTLLLFLLSELQAAKMYYYTNPPNSGINSGTEEFNQLKSICVALKMQKPPDDIGAAQFMTGVDKKIREAVANCPEGHLSDPVIKTKLGPVHWEKLSFLNKALQKEYETRRMMLLKRLDVTIDSFNWSDRAKTQFDQVTAAYQKKRFPLKPESDINISHLLAARDDISVISKTAYGTTRQGCAINKVLMGKVPDRGGRTDEISAPLPEMPSWQKRTAGGQGDQRSSSGHRGGGRGGRGKGHGDQRPSTGHRGGRGGRGRGRGGDDRPQSGGSRRGGGNWGRGRNFQQQGAFEQTFSRGGQGMGQGGFATGRQEYKS